MRHLRFDSVGGASGDMILSALCAMGVPAQELQARTASLGVESFEILTEQASDHGIHGLRVTVRCAEEHHPHRDFESIRDLIAASRLSDRVKEMSIAVFLRLAEAEARVHGTTPDHVHFHEVGAMDSIVDIVAACVALEWLKVDAVTFGPLPLGCGVVRCAHGVFPVPAPATVELLRGFAVEQSDEPFELVTPTGAALLTTWSQSLPGGGAAPERIVQVGHGLGHRSLQNRPNLLRAMLLEPVAEAQDADECVVLECNLDDLTPQLVGAVTQKLMSAGALDVFTVAAQMKKQRPGTLLTVLCRPEQRDRLVDLIFAESTTFGIRERITRRIVMTRRTVEANTPYGTVRVKVGTWKGRDVTQSPEYEDCVACADRNQVAVREVHDAALAAARGNAPSRQ